MRISATSSSDLAAQLAANNPGVQPRGQGRTKIQTEAWIAHRLVPTLARHGVLGFPLSFEDRDRPDLLISSNGIEIGAELTELVPPALAHANAIKNLHYPTAVLDRSIFTWGAAFSPQQIHEHLKQATKLSGPGWAGDAVERELAAAMNGALTTKAERLNQPGYSHYSENWLVAYASSPGPALDIAQCASLLQPPTSTATPVMFDRLVLIAGRKLLIVGGKILDIEEVGSAAQ